MTVTSQSRWLNHFAKSGHPLEEVNPGAEWFKGICPLDPLHSLRAYLPAAGNTISFQCLNQTSAPAETDQYHIPDLLRALGPAFMDLAAVFQDVVDKQAGVKFEEAVENRLEQKRVNDEADRRYLEELFGEPEVLEQRTLAEMLMEPDEEPDYRIQGLWPSGGNVILAAQRKTGKTTMVGNLIRCLVDGGSFLSQGDNWLIGSSRHLVRPVEPDQTVSLLDCEMARRQVRSWLSVHQIKNPDRVFVDTLRGYVHSFDFMSRQGLADWAERLRKRNTKILIVDPLGPILVANGVDNENDNSGIRKILMGLDRLCREAEIEELLIPHHAGHNGERSRGASVLRDWPDVEWRLLREPVKSGSSEEPDADGPRYFAAEGRDVMVSECKLGYDYTTRRLWIEGGTRKQAAADKNVPAMIEYVRDNPGQCYSKIKEALKGEMYERAVSAALKSGAQKGTFHTCRATQGTGVHYVLSDGCQSPTDCPSAKTAMIDNSTTSTGSDL